MAPETNNSRRLADWNRTRQAKTVDTLVFHTRTGAWSWFDPMHDIGGDSVAFGQRIKTPLESFYLRIGTGPSPILRQLMEQV